MESDGVPKNLSRQSAPPADNPNARNEDLLPPGVGTM